MTPVHFLSVTIVFEAAPGEANDVTVTGSDHWEGIEFRDATAPLSAGSGCVSLDEHTASCRFFDNAFWWIVLRAGDQDDTLSAAAFCPQCEQASSHIEMWGGPGDDTLIGGGEEMWLDGGEGADVLQGGPFGDMLHGGPGADMIDGRAHDGWDTVSYAGHSAPVSVVLDDGDPREGAKGERDTVVNVEGAIGGAGNDRLVGNARDNHFDGNGGSDILLGRAGDDQLSGGPGADTIRAGRGHDQWVTGGGGHDELHGGPGSDYLGGGDSRVPNRSRDNDTIYGRPGDDNILGHGGADRLFGADGDDEIRAQEGPDVLVGGRGRDWLHTGWRDGAFDRAFGGVDRDTAWVERLLDLVRGVEAVHRR